MHVPSSPIFNAVASSPGNRFVQQLSFGLSRAFFGGFVRLRVRGREHVTRPGGFVLAANHTAPFDPFLLAIAARRWIDWVTMAELYQRPAAAWYWRQLAAIPVDRGRTDSKAAALILARLRAGRPVGIFPEGGIRAAERSVLTGGEIGMGACRLALAAGVPLVPAVILHSEKMMTNMAGWLVPRRAFVVDVVFGEPLSMPASSLPVRGKAAAQIMQAELVRSMQALASPDSLAGGSSGA